MEYDARPSFWRRNHLTTHLFGVAVIAFLALLVVNRDSFLTVSTEGSVVTHGYSTLGRSALIVLSIFTALYAFVALTLFFNFFKPGKPTFMGETRQVKGGPMKYFETILKFPCLLVLSIPCLMADFASVDSKGIKFNRDQFWITPSITDIPFDTIQKLELKHGPLVTPSGNDHAIVIYLKNSQMVQAPQLLASMEGVEPLLRDAAKKNKFTIAGKW